MNFAKNVRRVQRERARERVHRERVNTLSVPHWSQIVLVYWIVALLRRRKTGNLHCETEDAKATAQPTYQWICTQTITLALVGYYSRVEWIRWEFAQPLACTLAISTAYHASRVCVLLWPRYQHCCCIDQFLRLNTSCLYLCDVMFVILHLLLGLTR